MRFRTGNLFKQSPPPDLIVVTTNGVLNVNRELVMGAGAAKQARQVERSLPRLFADEILAKKDFVIQAERWLQLYVYGFVSVTINSQRWGAFQTKLSPYAPAQYSLIGYSIVRLNRALWDTMDQIGTVGVNFPGIGLGKLQRDKIAPMLEELDSRVSVWELPT